MKIMIGILKLFGEFLETLFSPNGIDEGITKNSYRAEYGSHPDDERDKFNLVVSRIID